MAVQTKIFTFHSPEYKQALQLRYEVLRVPLGLQFTEAELKKDEKGIHFGLFEDGEILACLTIIKIDAGIMQIRQVAVATQQQGRGYGAELSEAAEQYAIANGCAILFCHARKTAVPFYEKLGFTIVSEEFTEVTIPHYVMEKRLV